MHGLYINIYIYTLKLYKDENKILKENFEKTTGAKKQAFRIPNKILRFDASQIHKINESCSSSISFRYTKFYQNAIYNQKVKTEKKKQRIYFSQFIFSSKNIKKNRFVNQRQIYRKMKRISKTFHAIYYQ